jgi:hypothetical protein
MMQINTVAQAKPKQHCTDVKFPDRKRVMRNDH